FSAGDVIADNASSGAYLVGDVAAGAKDLDLAAEAVEVVVDGEVVHRATGADVLGHPAEALALAVNDLATRGLAIEPGWVVLTGGMSDAVYATPGSTVTCRFANLGELPLECGRPA
ncbi:MAG: 4-oxalocrotonate decarboxylase, partial [Marmoricola sp.]|nr:4-oxalocrotonate decarboxylase [Marmoricola sp.]